DTERQVAIHRASGYLSITKAAYAKAKTEGFYKDQPYLETPLLELTNKEPTENSRGLRLGNMVQLRDIWAEEIEGALAGKKSAKEALDGAGQRGNAMLRQFDRTVSKKPKGERHPPPQRASSIPEPSDDIERFGILDHPLTRMVTSIN